MTINVQENNHQQRNNKAVYQKLIVVGVAMVIFSIVLFYVLASIPCSICKKQEAVCDLCSLGALFPAMIVGFFGVVSIVVNTIKLIIVATNPNHRPFSNRPVLATLRWFLAAILAIIGANCLREFLWGVSRDNTYSNTTLFNLLGGIISLALATLLIFWNKIFSRK